MSTSTPAAVNSSSSTSSNDVIILVPDQLSKTIIRPGSGLDSDRPPSGAQVTVHYTGRLLDGTKFDSSLDCNEPLTFTIGVRVPQVMKAWDVGVMSMTRGEKCVLTIKSDYAYGPAGSPPTIPPNATLKFEFELIDFDDTVLVPQTGGAVVKRRLQTGDELYGGFEQPNELSSITYTLDGVLHEEVTLGLTADRSWGVEEALKSMTRDERSQFIINPPYTSTPQQQQQEKVEIELHDFELARKNHQLTQREQLERMDIYKAIGNLYFKASQHERASDRYAQAIELLPLDAEERNGDIEQSFDDMLTDDELGQLKALHVSCWSNRAICASKLGQTDRVIECCNAALSIDPQHVKCLFARGKAFAAMHSFDDARADLTAALKHDPSNVEVKKALAGIQATIKAQQQRERSAFGGMFNRV